MLEGSGDKLDNVALGMQEKLVMLHLIGINVNAYSDTLKDYVVSINGDLTMHISYRDHRESIYKYDLSFFTLDDFELYDYSNEKDLLEKVLELLDRLIKEVA